MSERRRVGRSNDEIRQRENNPVVLGKTCFEYRNASWFSHLSRRREFRVSMLLEPLLVSVLRGLGFRGEHVRLPLVE